MQGQVAGRPGVRLAVDEMVAGHVIARIEAIEVAVQVPQLLGAVGLQRFHGLVGDPAGPLGGDTRQIVSTLTDFGGVFAYVSFKFLRIATDGRITLTLHIQPGAKKTEFGGLHGDALKIRLAAPPVDGKANEALIKFVADTLGLPKSAVTIKSGQTSRRKALEVIGGDARQIAALAAD